MSNKNIVKKKKTIIPIAANVCNNKKTLKKNYFRIWLKIKKKLGLITDVHIYVKVFIIYYNEIIYHYFVNVYDLHYDVIIKIHNVYKQSIPNAIKIFVWEKRNICKKINKYQGFITIAIIT